MSLTLLPNATQSSAYDASGTLTFSWQSQPGGPTRIRLEEHPTRAGVQGPGGALRWERALDRREPVPLHAWVDASGTVAVLGQRWNGLALTLLDGEKGLSLTHPQCLSHFDAIGEGRTSWLRFSLAHFFELPSWGTCFSLRLANGWRVVIAPISGSIVPQGGAESWIAGAEVEFAERWLRHPHLEGFLEGRGPSSERIRSDIGASVLSALEHGRRDLIPKIRELEWAGGPCRFPRASMHQIDPTLAEVHDLRRLAQRALYSFGEEPRPLRGATIERAGRLGPVATSLQERAGNVYRICVGQSPEEVLEVAGHPDDVTQEHWDYGLYSEGETIRVHWAARPWRQARVLGVDRRVPLSATARYRGFVLPLDGVSTC